MREADFYIIFETPNPAIALCIGGWDYGEKFSAPYELPAESVEGIAAGLEQVKGCRLFQNKNSGFNCFIAVGAGIDADKACGAAKAFLIQMVTELLDEAVAEQNKPSPLAPLPQGEGNKDRKRGNDANKRKNTGSDC